MLRRGVAGAISAIVIAVATIVLVVVLVLVSHSVEGHAVESHPSTHGLPHPPLAERVSSVGHTQDAHDTCVRGVECGNKNATRYTQTTLNI